MLRKALVVTATLVTAIVGANLAPLPANAALAYNFDNWTFTPCGATGRSGPSLAQCQTEYASSSFASDTNYFKNDGYGMQLWKPPVAGNYTFEVAGAGGGGTNGGKGGVFQFSATLSATTWVCLQVGQKGEADTNFPESGGGGGASAINVTNTSTTACTSSMHAGGGGGGGTTAGGDAAAQISYLPGYTTGGILAGAGSGANAGPAINYQFIFGFGTSGCASGGGPLTGCLLYTSPSPRDS